MSDDRREPDPDSSESNQVMQKITRSGEMPFALGNQVIEPNSGLGDDPLSFDSDDAAAKTSISLAALLTWRWLLVYAVCGIIFAVVAQQWIKSLQSKGVAKSSVVAQLGNKVDDDIDDGPPVFTTDPKEVAESFVAEQNPQERLKWVRNPKEVATRMSAYPAQALHEPVSKLVDLGLVNNGREVVAGFGAVFENGDKRLVSVVATEDGPLVDWDCYARYCSASWPDLFEGKVKTAEVRVYAKPDNYYNFEFRDGEVWDGFFLSSPDLDVPVYGYAKEGTKVAEILNSTLPWTDGVGLKMTLQISAMGNSAKHRQFLIERVLAYSWVRGARDMQDTWITPIPEKEESKSSEQTPQTPPDSP